MSAEAALLKKYKEYVDRSTTKYLNAKLIPGFFILLYFIYSDIWLIGESTAAYTRIFPVLLAGFLIVFNSLKKDYYSLRAGLYNLLLASLPVMMYAKCLIHLEAPDFAGHVTGLVVVIFLVSIDIRTRLYTTILIYLLPAVIFLFILLFFFEPTIEQLTDLSNVIPILVLGFIANRTQNKFRYDLFRTNIQLEKQKTRAEGLLEEMQATNRKLNYTNSELEESEDQLRKVLVTKEKFFSIIAHDLKSPFNALQGFADMLIMEDPAKEPGKFREYAESIRQASYKLYSLTENLLNWSRSQIGEIETQTETLDAAEIIKDAVDTMAIQARSKNISIQYHSEEKLGFTADRETILLVLRNLISNSIKYSDRGSRINIDARQMEDKVLISVSDNGTGIPEENMDKLFSLEKSLSIRGTSGESGTGLGLVLCKTFVEMNGGRIWAESSEGEGSTFYTELPGA